MRTFGLITSAGTRESFRWPMDEAAVIGALPEIAGWREWGSSMTGGFDDRMGVTEGIATRLSDRVAGVLNLAPHAIRNEGIFGSDIMDSSANGFGRVLRLVKPHSTYQEWPWEPHNRWVEHFWWGINGIGAGFYRNTGSYWTEQAAMWQTVWTNDWRSVIQRCIAGAIYYPGAAGASPTVWRNANAAGGAANMVGDPAFAFLGPAAGGASHWQYRADASVSTNGYWWTDQQGDRVIIKVPVDYDTGTVAIRHLCPGSYFDGPAQLRDGLGVLNGPGGNQLSIRTGAEHARSPSAVSMAATGMTTVVTDCRGLANRINVAGSGVNAGPGNIGPEGVMSHVSRLPLPPTPGTVQTVTLTVTTLPSGGWYGFDSWEIEAVPMLRPLVVINDVADPASWTNNLYFFTESLWPLLSTRAQAHSDALAALVASYADPGIMMAATRAKTALHPQNQSTLYDGNAAAPDGLPDGYPVELSSRSTYTESGDGIHGHAIHEHDVIEAVFEALARSLPLIGRGRGAMPFAPGRTLGHALRGES